MRVLVIGGTGQVGRHIVPALSQRGVEAITAARNPGLGGVALDLAEPDTIADAARGCDAAYLTTPVQEDETAIALPAIDALRRAGLGRIVYLSIHNVGAQIEIPHFAAKMPIERAVLAGGGVALGANFFQENDLLAGDAIRYGGLYPLPVGAIGVANIGVADIAAAAVNALLSPAWDGEAVPLCGPDDLTGPMLAANWTAALGREVRYPGDDTAAFLDGVAQVWPMTPWLRDDLDRMMRVTQARGNRASAADRAAAAAIIGRPPRAHADFALQTARQWAAEEMKR